MSRPPSVPLPFRDDAVSPLHRHAQSTGHASSPFLPPPEQHRSNSVSVGNRNSLRGMRRLEARRTMELSHYETQRARTFMAAPIDFRSLEYVSAYNENLVCPICRCPFVDPVMLNDCDHYFCRDCIRQTWAVNATAHTPSETRGSCPACRAPAKMGPRSATSKLIVNILDELIVECPTPGCEIQVRRGEVQDHVGIYCGYATIACPGTDCELSARRMDRDQGCLHYSVSCRSCRKEMHKSALEGHWKTECADHDVKCSQCKQKVLYRELEEHKVHSCPSVVIPCPGAIYGCGNRSKRAQSEVHAKSCALARLAPVLTAQAKRMEEHEVAQRQLTRKLEVLQDGFATIQTILDTRPSNPDNDAADETRIPFLPGHSRGASVATVGTALSPEDYDFPQPPSRTSEDSGTSLVRSMHTANMSPPRRAPPAPPGTLRRDLAESFSSDFDLADPFLPPSTVDPYASPLHHLLSMHESLREEMSRMATTLQELDGRHSMQMLNENIRSRDEVAHLGAQVAAIGRQVHWLTSTQLQRTQARGGAAQEGSAGPSTQYGDASAGVGIEAAVNAVSTAATALRGAARMVNVGREGGPVMRRGTSEEGRTKL